MAILGIDEVGRGPLAGPLVVGAVILPDDKPDWVDELKDSKKLTPKKRNELNEVILKQATVTGLGWVSAAKIDEIGISAALILATKKAVKSIQSLHAPFSQIIIDGKVNFLKETKLGKYVSTMPKADDLIKEVSAASIIAKVARDNYMIKLAEKYPSYGFEKHVGYGTARHITAIREFGITPEHRKSFEPIRSMVGFERHDDTVVKNTTAIGSHAEQKVVEALTRAGHTIIARNYKTKIAEIDIISVQHKTIYFTEVKYRKNENFGSPLEAITKDKLKKMRMGAEMFIKTHQKYDRYDISLAAAEVVNSEFNIKDWFVIT